MRVPRHNVKLCFVFGVCACAPMPAFLAIIHPRPRRGIYHVRFFPAITVNDTDLTFHRIRVDLAHVLSAVLLLHAVYVQVPGAEIGMADGNSGVVCDDVVMNRLDGLSVGLHPSHLCRRIYVNQGYLLCSWSPGDHLRRSWIIRKERWKQGK